MHFLGTPDIGPLMFAGLTLASFATAFIGVFTGTAGGLILLAMMAVVMPPSVVIPVHTVVQLGSGVTRTMIMWRYVMYTQSYTQPNIHTHVHICNARRQATTHT